MKDYQIYVHNAQGVKESTTSAAVACDFAVRFAMRFYHAFSAEFRQCK
jgi:hypothetical protein